MLKLRTSARLACCVGLLASAAVWLALALGILQNSATKAAGQRVTTARYISVIAASMVNNRREKQLQIALDQFVEGDESLVSVGVRSYRGSLISAGPHEAVWVRKDPLNASSASVSDEQSSASNQIQADLLANGQPFGTIELVFQTADQQSWSRFFAFPIPLTIFIGAVVSLFSWLIFARAFKYMDPSQVVPDRVRLALDTMAEGLVLLDHNCEIGHANEAFERIAGVDVGDLLGRSIDMFEWAQSSDFGSSVLPWVQCLEEQRAVCGIVVDLIIGSQPTRKFIVNATPIVSDNDRVRGVLVSFDDVTVMEEKKRELSQMISTLRQSRDEVARKNEQLNFFASYDQLTECLNRREFFLRIDSCWADESNENIGVIMLDIDHFKSVNDNHGHGAGDEVLRCIAKLLRDCVDDRGIVARLGGEEFVVLLPNIGIQASGLIGEEIRRKVDGAPIGGLDITVSVGVSSREMKPMDSQHLLDQADQALYVGKNCGRNRVVRFDEREVAEAAYARQDETAEMAMAGEEAAASELVLEVESLVEESRVTVAEPRMATEPAEPTAAGPSKLPSPSR